MTSQQLAWLIRRHGVEMTHLSCGSHIGAVLSVADIVAVLYADVMKYDPENPEWDGRDRFILGKGHAGAAIYAALAECGFFPTEELKTHYKNGSRLSGHVSHHVPGVDFSTGSLGHALPVAAGMAFAALCDNKDHRVFAVLGDGECDEGSNWEAAMSINAFHATNVISFVDRNKCMIDGRTEDVMPLEPFADKWRAFGFHVFDIDGHNMMELSNAIDYALGEPDAPVMIIANTIKGEGIDFMEDDYHWHYGAVDEAKYKEAKESLKKHYEKRIARVEKEAK